MCFIPLLFKVNCLVKSEWLFIYYSSLLLLPFNLIKQLVQESHVQNPLIVLGNTAALSSRPFCNNGSILCLCCSQ